MAYDKDNPLADDIIASEDPAEALRNLGRRGIFVHDPAFYSRMHNGTTGKLNLAPPFWGGIAILLDHCGDLTVHPYVFIDDFAIVYTHEHDPTTELKFWEPIAVPKEIGSFVYIGPRATIASSCRVIGEGAVIQAGAYVIEDVDTLEIVGGNPAKHVGWREDGEANIKDLKQLFEPPDPEDHDGDHRRDPDINEADEE